jgi:hypothetical protein
MAMIWCLLHSRASTDHFLLFVMGDDDSGEKEVATLQEVTSWCTKETPEEVQLKAPNGTVWGEEATRNGSFRLVPNSTNGLDESDDQRIDGSVTTCFVEEDDTNGEGR